jgi:hypothetical protein
MILALVASLVVVLGFTAFVAPGFLVDDDSESNGDEGGPGTRGRGDQAADGAAPAEGTEPAGSGEPDDGGGGQEAAPASIEEFGQALADAVDQHATDDLAQMLCADATQYPRDAFNTVDGIDSAALAGTDGTDPNASIVTLEVAFGSDSGRYDFIVIREADGLCVQDGHPAA